MECACVRHTDLPNTSRLFADYLYDFGKLRDFYPHSPFDSGSYANAAREVDLEPGRRAALVEALAVHNAGSQWLESLAQPRTVAVVTGQQVGLFSGPCYTVYKALTAVKLARRLTEAGIPAVPVFWLATEDHDFAEIAHNWVFDTENRPFRLEAEAQPGSAVRPVGEIPVGPVPIERLRATLSNTPFGDSVTASAAAAYAPGSTYGSAFRTLLGGLLGEHAPLFFDPMLGAMRSLAAPAIRSALAAAPELTAGLRERTAALLAAGYHGQVHVEPDTSLVFLLENGRRLALKRHEDEYVRNGKRYSAAELAGRAELLSPNALLRPVVQDSILPTVAYVGGPAELAYLAQSEVIYRRLLGRMPVAVPRASMTLLDGRSRKIIDRYGLRLPDFFHGLAALQERMALSLTPQSLTQELEAARSATAGALARVETALAGFDPTLRAAFEKSRRKIEYQLSKTERKIWREHMRRDERATDDATRLFDLVYPEKHLQERLYSILPFLAGFGPDLIPAIYHAIRPECPDHQLLTM
jgi:bacillithiol synthase